MQTTRILQAVALMLILALAASCATSNQYVGKLFNPRPFVKDTQAMAIKFLELDSLEAGKEWVQTDITKDKDSTEVKTIPVAVETKATPLPQEPIAKTNNPDGTRTKKTRE